MNLSRKIVLSLAVAMVAAVPVRAAELVMLERPGCVWCAKFNEEIAPAYPSTEQGRRAPLRRVDVTGEWPTDLQGMAAEQFTPTFLLVVDGEEIGRIRGYPGDEFFWYLLDELIAELDQRERP